MAVFPQLLKLSGRLSLLLHNMPDNVAAQEVQGSLKVSACATTDSFHLQKDFYTPLTAYEEPESDEEAVAAEDLDDDVLLAEVRGLEAVRRVAHSLKRLVFSFPAHRTLMGWRSRPTMWAQWRRSWRRRREKT